MINLIYFFAIYSISYFIRNLSGPFNIFGLTRNFLLRSPYFGTFFYKLLNCPWCLGFHCGYMIYLLEIHKEFNPKLLILWGLAGSFIVALMDKLVERLENNNESS